MQMLLNLVIAHHRRKVRQDEVPFPAKGTCPLPPIGSGPWKLDCDMGVMIDGKVQTVFSRAVETVERKKDKERCAACGKRKDSNSSLEL